MQLRDYQKECLRSVIKGLKNNELNQLVVAATGTGKTVTFCSLPKILKLTKPTLILAGMDSLLHQAIKQWKEVHGESSIVGLEQGSNHIDEDIKYDAIFASVQTLKNERLSRLLKRDFGLIIYDEAHHSEANTSQTLLEALGCLPLVDSKRPSGASLTPLIGFTATPDRADKKSLSTTFPYKAYDYGTFKALENGHWSPVRARRVLTNTDLTEVGVRNGEYNGAPIDPSTPLGKMLGELSGMGQSTVGENPEGGDPSDMGEGDGGGITNLPPSRILTAGQAATMLEQLGKAFVKEIQDIQSSSGSSHPSTFEKRYTKKIEPVEIRRIKKEVGNTRPLKYIATGLTKLNSDGAYELNPEEFGTAAGSGGVPGIFHAGSRQKLFLRKSKMKEDLERISTLDAQGKIDCFFRSKVKKVPTKTPTPSFRRDRLATALISQGRAPSMYRSSTPKNPSGLVHLYIDVSGSCTQFIPKFLDFMEPMKDLCHEVCHIFSTEVYDVSRDELIRSRNYKSTGGTSLSCILDHMKKNKIHLACIMSDGYMSATDEEMKWAKETRVDVVTLTTPGAATTCQLYDLSTIVSSLENYTKDRRKGGSSK